MSLPIDRTSKATLDGNLVNGNTSDAPAIKGSNDVVYNTIDELNAKVDGLVTTGTLSQASVTPIANKIAQRDANGNVLSAFPVSNGQNPNLFFNPSARMGLTGWTATNSAGSSWSAAFGVNGEGGYFTCGSASNGTPILQSTFVSSAANQPITLSVEMFTSGVTVGQQICELQFFDNTNALISAISVVATNGQSWTRYTVSGTTPANTASMKVRCFGQSTFTTTNSAWRKIKVESGSVATTFSDDNTLNTQQFGSVLPLTQVLSGGNKEHSGNSSGVVATAGTAVDVIITFPIPFAAAPTGFASFTAPSVGDAGYVNVRVKATTTTTMTVTVNSYVAQTINFSWLAKGT